jgi:hypothetical protein
LGFIVRGNGVERRANRQQLMATQDSDLHGSTLELHAIISLIQRPRGPYGAKSVGEIRIRRRRRGDGTRMQ